MKIEMPENNETFVTFKDYGFFMPLDSDGKNVIVNGIAFMKTTPVDELKHYAQDAGKPQSEIDKIIKPKKEVQFIANGVKILN